MKKIMVLLMLTFIFVSCGEAVTEVADKSETSAVVTAAEETTERYTLPDADFDGEDVVFIVRGDTDIYWKEKDYYAEMENGEPFNDAVYTRNRKVEERYNVNIKEIRAQDVYGESRKQILADSVEFDMMSMHIQNSALLAQQGFLLDLYEVPNLQLDREWWDQRHNDDMNMYNKLFFSLGDINTIDNDATWVVLFNKDISENYGMADHYGLVNDKKWTLDVLHANCLNATADLNGDGVLTPEDQWGAVNQYECAYALAASAGIKSVKKTADDSFELDINTPYAVSVMEKIYAFMTDGNAQVKADDPAFSGKYSNIWTEINVNSFLESRALYYISPMCTVPFFRGMEQNFGLVPLPMYEENQSSYNSPLQYNNATAISFPVASRDIERSSLIVEMMAAESADTIIKAYYDINLKTKLARDDESVAMLDLLFAERLYDIGIAFNWNNIQGFYQDVVRSASFNFASLYETKAEKTMSEMQKTIDLFSEIG